MVRLRVTGQVPELTLGIAQKPEKPQKHKRAQKPPKHSVSTFSGFSINYLVIDAAYCRVNLSNDAIRFFSLKIMKRMCITFGGITSFVPFLLDLNMDKRHRIVVALAQMVIS